MACQGIDCFKELIKGPFLIEVFEKERIAKLTSRCHHAAEVGFCVPVGLHEIVATQGISHLERRSRTCQLCDGGVMCGSEFTHSGRSTVQRTWVVRWQ